MRRVLVAFAIALLVVLAAFAALIINPPIGYLQNRLAAEIKSATGRDLNVAGKTSLQIVPSIKLRLEDATLSHPPGFAGGPFLRVGALEVNAGLQPLLQGRFEIDRVTLSEPRVALIVNKQGQKSWDFAAPKTEPSSSTGPFPAINELTVTRAAVAFKDERIPAGFELADVNVKAQRVAPDQPLSAEFDLNWNKQKIDGKLGAQSLAALAGGGSTDTTLALSSALGAAEFEGKLATAEPARFDGKMSGSAPSLRTLAAWLDMSLPGSEGFGKATFKADVKANGKSIAFPIARLVVDDTTTDGTLAIDLSGVRPRVTGTLAADQLDVARYIPAAAPAMTRSTPAPVFEIEAVPLSDSLKAYLKAAETRGPAAAGLPDATSQELTRAAPRPAWSTAPFDVAPLKAVDADLDVSVRALKYNKAAVNVQKAAVALNDGKLAVEAKEVATHGGKVAAKTVLDAKPGVPAFTASLKLDDVDVHSLMTDLGFEGYVSGKTTGEAELSGAGRSEQDLVSSLKGRAKARVGQGVVVGYDVKKAIETWRLPPYDPKARTPFERIDADVKLDKGIAQSTVMQLSGPVVGATADGVARLPTRQLDYNARVSFPNWWSIAVRIFGPFTQLKYDVDWFSTLFSRQTPAATRMAVAEGLDLKDAELAGMLEGALKKAEASPTRSPDDFDPEILRALLKRAKGE
jgi:AsmA protein